MANNRIFLHCAKCDKRLSVAEYYPSTGWWVRTGNNFRTTLASDEELIEEAAEYVSRLCKWLEDHSHDKTLWGNEHISPKMDIGLEE